MLPASALRILCAAACCATSASQAASFDCARARTYQEHHICNTPALNTADAAMGAAYKAASAYIPVKDAVLALQQVFHTSYKTCDQKDDGKCIDELKEQTAKLQSMVGATVYASLANNAGFGPEDHIFWLTPGPAQATLHYFGSYMPDMMRPAPFPDGIVCDDEVTVTKTATGYSLHENFQDIDVTDKEVVSKLGCGGRTGIFGTTPRVR